MSLRDGASRPGAAYATDQYFPVFLLVIAALVFLTLVTDDRAPRVVVSLVLVLAVLGSLRATGVTPRTLRWAVVVGVALGSVVVAAGFADTSWFIATVALAIALVLGLAATSLLRRIFEQPVIGLREVVAALTAYIQYAIGFGFAYAAVARYVGGDFFQESTAAELGDFVYFSVVTMTTLGYGDLTPVTDVGRAMAMLQTLFGQVFLVVLVAYLVGALGRDRKAAAGG